MIRPMGEHVDEHMAEYISARRAAAVLDIKLPTLYAYVSRGLIRSVPGTEGRPRRYARADVERLKARADARRGHGAVAAGALRWGEPVLDSELTEIAMFGHRYRGHDARELARTHAFEQVAELLWTGRLPTHGRSSAGPDDRPLWPHRPDLAAIRQVRELVPGRATAIAHLAALVAVLTADVEGDELASETKELAFVRQLILTMAAALTPGERGLRPPRSLADEFPAVAERLLWALSGRPAAVRDNPAVADAHRRVVNSALILIADHELNASSFTARVAASVGAALPACVSAGLATLSGHQHGGMCDRVEAFVSDIRSPDDVAATLAHADDSGRSIPGFGHRLYPDGDPRARALLELAAGIVRAGTSGRRTPSVAWQTLEALIATMAEHERGAPTSDVGLVGLAIALGLRPGSAAALFAIGRTAGLVAHALEQRAAGFMLRPRARYTGR